MPLTVAAANAKTEAINDAFADIGYANGTAMPGKRRSNTEQIAWEYHVSSHLLRIAEARRATAIKEAIAAGVIFDPEKEQMEPGTNALFYTSDVVEVAVSVATPLERFDRLAFIADLEKAKVPAKTLLRLARKHTTEHRPAHKFMARLATK